MNGLTEQIKKYLKENEYESFKKGDRVQGLNRQGKPHDEYVGTFSHTQKDGNHVIRVDKPLSSTGQSEVVLEPKDLIKLKK